MTGVNNDSSPQIYWNNTGKAILNSSTDRPQNEKAESNRNDKVSPNRHEAVQQYVQSPNNRNLLSHKNGNHLKELTNVKKHKSHLHVPLYNRRRVGPSRRSFSYGGYLTSHNKYNSNSAYALNKHSVRKAFEPSAASCPNPQNFNTGHQRGRALKKVRGEKKLYISLSQIDKKFIQMRDRNMDGTIEWNRRFEPDHHYVYTDGSWKNSLGGIGIYHGPNHKLNRSQHIPKSDQYSCETTAVKVALEDLGKNEIYKSKTIVVRTDCLGIIESVKSVCDEEFVPRQLPDDIHEIVKLCYEFPKGVHIEHVYAHDDDIDYGNLAADVMARSALNKNNSVGTSHVRDRSLDRNRMRSRNNNVELIESHRVLVRKKQPLIHSDNDETKKSEIVSESLVPIQQSFPVNRELTSSKSCEINLISNTKVENKPFNENIDTEKFDTPRVSQTEKEISRPASHERTKLERYPTVLNISESCLETPCFESPRIPSVPIIAQTPPVVRLQPVYLESPPLTHWELEKSQSDETNDPTVSPQPEDTSDDCLKKCLVFFKTFITCCKSNK